MVVRDLFLCAVREYLTFVDVLEVLVEALKLLYSTRVRLREEVVGLREEANTVHLRP
jgi:hypothetical protein